MQEISLQSQGEVKHIQTHCPLCQSQRQKIALETHMRKLGAKRLKQQRMTHQYKE